jgi:plasmid stabilization system protein ParE
VKVLYSPRAARDLANVGEFLSERSPSGAVAVEHRIRTVVDLIARFPASGRRLEQRPSVSVMPLGNYPYRIFYMTSGEQVTILHIRHSSRKPAGPGDF